MRKKDGYVLVWVKNSDDFWELGVIDTVDWFYASEESLKGGAG